jgi:hypothetical protein
VFLVDNAHLGDPRHTASASGEVVRRSLSDGREFEIVKRFWAPTGLERELAALGWQLSAGATPNGHFVFASGQRRVFKRRRRRARPALLPVPRATGVRFLLLQPSAHRHDNRSRRCTGQRPLLPDATFGT